MVARFVQLTKHIAQVKSISSLTESKSSHDRDGFPSLSTREHPSKSAAGFLELPRDSLKFIWKAMSSQSHGD